ncbi:hypothetical protein [Nonomuraea sp. NPDC049480]|uniref:hypothetical protein n=1 Tax=Nonomuraea sp. NPDC049480 TaxID=3364353 RepID=UPI0037A4A2DA
MSDDRPNDDDSSQEEPMPYEERTEDGYAQHVTKHFTMFRSAGAMVLSGPCPRCCHAMEYLVGPVIRGPRAQPVTSTSREPMICMCKGDHPNRPKDYHGCGAYWDVNMNVKW